MSGIGMARFHETCNFLLPLNVLLIQKKLILGGNLQLTLDQFTKRTITEAMQMLFNYCMAF